MILRNFQYIYGHINTISGYYTDQSCFQETFWISSHGNLSPKVAASEKLDFDPSIYNVCWLDLISFPLKVQRAIAC